ESLVSTRVRYSNEPGSLCESLGMGAGPPRTLTLSCASLSFQRVKGLLEIGLPDSRESTLLGKYWTGVDRYRDTGDASALRQFRGKHLIDTEGKRVPLLTDLR